MQATVYPANKHPVKNALLSPNAIKVTHGLQKAGYRAYLVGGCVRDIYLGFSPKDFDVVTNATPEQVKATFRNCRLIGRRFRLAHVLFGREVIEVATFRGHHVEVRTDTDNALGKTGSEGQLLRDNVYGTMEEDASRRDFNINAMYYDPDSGELFDFANGRKAVSSGVFDLIGNPETRYREDPVRMLRAVRFSAKLGMDIAPQAATPITKFASLLSNIPPARLFEECLKLFLAGAAVQTYEQLQKYGIFGILFPQLQPYLSDSNSKEVQFLLKVLMNTDTRINNNQRVTPAFLFAAILWYPLEEECNRLVQESGLNAHDAFNIAMGEVLQRQTQRIMIPKRFTAVIRDIWQLQRRLPKRFGKRAYQNLEHPKFRAGYDFLLFRGQIEGGELLTLAQWWTKFQSASPAQQKNLLSSIHSIEGRPQRRRRKPRKPSHDS